MPLCALCLPSESHDQMPADKYGRGYHTSTPTKLSASWRQTGMASVGSQVRIVCAIVVLLSDGPATISSAQGT